MSFGDDTLDPMNSLSGTRCPASREVKRLQCIGMDGHGGSHADADGGTWENTPLSQRQPRQTPLALAASVTGHIQQALEELHELTTYQLSSATVHRHRGTVEQITKALISTRNTAAGFALILGKEGV